MKWRSNVLDHQLSQRVLLKGACFFIQIVSSVWWNTIISISSALPSIIRVVQTLGWKWPKGKPNLKGMASCNQTKEKTELDSLRQLLPCIRKCHLDFPSPFSISISISVLSLLKLALPMSLRQIMTIPGLQPCRLLAKEVRGAFYLLDRFRKKIIGYL